MKAIVSALILPPAGPLLVALLGWLLLRRRQSRIAALLLGAGLLSSVLLSLPVVAGALAYFVEGPEIAAPTADALRRAARGPGAAGAVVILGGGARWHERELPHRQTVHGRTLERLEHGAWVARVTGLPILVSGGLPSVGPEQDRVAEAVVMARTLREGFRMEVRWAESASPDTAQNARRSAAMLAASGIRKVILVTHAVHMPRARLSFEAAGLEVVAAPHGFAGSLSGERWGDWVPNSNAVYWSWLASHEAIGLWWYRLQLSRQS